MYTFQSKYKEKKGREGERKREERVKFGQSTIRQERRRVKQRKA